MTAAVNNGPSKNSTESVMENLKASNTSPPPGNPAVKVVMAGYEAADSEHRNRSGQASPNKAVAAEDQDASVEDPVEDLEPRMTEEEGRQHLRSSWQFIAIAQFLRVFAAILRIEGAEDYETETLEDALLSMEPTAFLRNIHIALLRTVTDNRLIRSDNWEYYLKRTFETRFEGPSLLMNMHSYWDLRLILRVQVLHDLCELLLVDIDRFRLKVKDESEENFWRVDPIGRDAQGNLYWLFDDNRLYKETIPTRKKASRRSRGSRKRKSAEDDINSEGSTWSLICSTLDEWRLIPERFENSRNSSERELYSLLTENLLPDILPVFEEKQRLWEERLQIESRKRSSRLATKELERMEIEEQKRKIEKETKTPRNFEPDEMATRSGRLSDRVQRQAEYERERQQAERELRRLRREEALLLGKVDTSPRPKKKTKNEWIFNCYCGVRQTNWDDGKKMMACGRCGVWQHVGCVTKWFGKMDWAKVEYVCSLCRSRETLQSNAQPNEHVVDVMADNADKPEQVDLLSTPMPLPAPLSSTPKKPRAKTPKKSQGEKQPVESNQPKQTIKLSPNKIRLPSQSKPDSSMELMLLPPQTNSRPWNGNLMHSAYNPEATPVGCSSQMTYRPYPPFSGTTPGRGPIYYPQQMVSPGARGPHWMGQAVNIPPDMVPMRFGPTPVMQTSVSQIDLASQAPQARSVQERPPFPYSMHSVAYPPNLSHHHQVPTPAMLSGARLSTQDGTSALPAHPPMSPRSSVNVGKSVQSMVIPAATSGAESALASMPPIPYPGAAVSIEPGSHSSTVPPSTKPVHPAMISTVQSLNDPINQQSVQSQSAVASTASLNGSGSLARTAFPPVVVQTAPLFSGHVLRSPPSVARSPTTSTAVHHANTFFQNAKTTTTVPTKHLDASKPASPMESSEASTRPSARNDYGAFVSNLAISAAHLNPGAKPTSNGGSAPIAIVSSHAIGDTHVSHQPPSANSVPISNGSLSGVSADPACDGL